MVDDSTPGDVAAIVGRSAAAADALATSSPAQRRIWLDAVASGLELHQHELTDLADAETALGAVRLAGEIGRAASQLRFYGDVAAEGSYLGAALDQATLVSPRLARINRPLGPVAVFGASNFPFAFGVLGNDTASALAAGCPVVAKAHPAHVLTCQTMGAVIEHALRDAGAPDGTFGLVTGWSAGLHLVGDERIKAVGFTGSQAGGLALWRRANERAEVIPVYAEMGTVNPVVVTPAGAERIEQVASGFVGSFTLGVGQFCTKPGVLFAPAGRQAADLVAAALAATDFPPPVMLTEAIARSLNAGIADLVSAGATVIGTVAGPGAGWSGQAAVLSAPIGALKPGSRLLDECFGPVVLVVEYADRVQLDEALEQLQGSLAASVFGGGAGDPDLEWLVAKLSRRAGRVAVGDWPTGVAVAWAQQHGGPWPATTAPSTTSVGAAALARFVRPVTFQSVDDAVLPETARAAFAADNPWNIPRRIDGVLEAL